MRFYLTNRIRRLWDRVFHRGWHMDVYFTDTFRGHIPTMKVSDSLDDFNQLLADIEKEQKESK